MTFAALSGLGLAWRLALLVFFVLINAFLAAAETALVKVSEFKSRSLVEEGVKGSEVLAKVVSKPSRYLSTILVITLLVALGASSLATSIALSLEIKFAPALATGVMTFLVFIFGEMAPKSYSVGNYEKVALLVAPLINLLATIFYPVIRILILISNGVVRLFGGKTGVEGIFVTEGDIRAMVNVAEEQSVIEAEEKKLIHSIFEFGDTLVREVMVPRTDMVALPETASLETAIDTIVQTGFSRIPVYRKNIDDIVGVIYAKDLLPYLKRGEMDVTPKEIMREPIFVPESRRVIELLTDLRSRKTHLAVVLDEYGGTAGLVTIEDLLEEIVGEIFDEYDREVVLCEPLGDGRYMLDARISIDDVNDLLGTNLPAHEWDTLGGLMYNLLGRVPKQGESVMHSGIRLTANKVIGRRISKVLLEVVSEEKG